MEKKYFLSLIVIFFLFFIPLAAQAAWSVIKYTVEPTNVLVGQSVAISIVVASNAEDDPETGVEINYGDGSPVYTGTCSPSLPGRLSNCGFQLHHRYSQANNYRIVVTLTPGRGQNIFIQNIPISVVSPVQRATRPTTISISPISAISLPEWAERIAGFVYWIGNGMVILFILLGGFTIIAAAGEPRAIQKGKNTIFYSLIAFAIMTMARGIFELINVIFGVR